MVMILPKGIDKFHPPMSRKKKVSKDV